MECQILDLHLEGTHLYVEIPKITEKQLNNEDKQNQLKGKEIYNYQILVNQSIIQNAA